MTKHDHLSGRQDAASIVVSTLVQALIAAADQFIVVRGDLKTVIARLSLVQRLSCDTIIALRASHS
jgi:hypothetical protein